MWDIAVLDANGDDVTFDFACFGGPGYECPTTYRVKRVNNKTFTLDGGGGGWNDPKREYDRVLSRTRDGITITSPEDPQ